MNEIGFNVNISYPYDKDYDVSTEIFNIDLDEERKNDILNNKGFLITAPKGIVKDIKDPDGIFSTRFGQTLADTNPFIDRYRCQCGTLMSRVHHGIICKICNTPVEEVVDDLDYYGWIVLDKHYIIHPNIYKSLEYLIGSDKLKNILEPIDEKDQDGHSTNIRPVTKDEPFIGIGMISFMERFVEIMDFYLAKTPKKVEYYNHIMNDIGIAFIQSIPVFTTQLRPFSLENRSLSYEGVNGKYTMISRLAASINNDTLKIFRKRKDVNLLLADLQFAYNDLIIEIDKNLSGKKGNIRQLQGGRYNFCARMVIIADPKLRSDQITLPYKALVSLLQQPIVNILQKTYNMIHNDAWKLWYKATIVKDELVAQIIQALIFSNPQGLAFVVNRNPTIVRGSLLQLFCIGMTDTYTMGIPLQVLSLLKADFDGDALNMFMIINKQFYERANQILNPRNSMCISNNDGKINTDMMPQRDRLINANTLLRLGRKHYRPEQLEIIKNAVELNKQ